MHVNREKCPILVRGTVGARPQRYLTVKLAWRGGNFPLVKAPFLLIDKAGPLRPPACTFFFELRNTNTLKFSIANGTESEEPLLHFFFHVSNFPKV